MMRQIYINKLFNKINLFVKIASMSLVDAQSILGVSPFASEEEVKKAYRNKIFEIHPDRFMTADKKTKQKMQNEAVMLNAARDVMMSSFKYQSKYNLEEEEEENKKEDSVEKEYATDSSSYNDSVKPTKSQIFNEKNKCLP